MRRTRAFTLIELIIVVAIIAILAALLFPVLAAAREKARSSACLSNYHQVGLAIQSYAEDSDSGTPPDGGSFSGLIKDCAPYTHSPAVFRCPDDWDREREGRAGSYRVPTLYQAKSIDCGWKDPYHNGDIAQPASTTLAYEAEQDFSQAPIVTTFRHTGGTQILLFDGHAKWVRGKAEQRDDPDD